MKHIDYYYLLYWYEYIEERKKNLDIYRYIRNLIFLLSNQFVDTDKKIYATYMLMCIRKHTWGCWWQSLPYFDPVATDDDK